MGLTSWVARYRLPNARPTPVCEWELPETLPAEAPGERLHALLDETSKAPAPRAPVASGREHRHTPAVRGKARSLLDGDSVSPPGDPTPALNARPQAEAAAEAPLRFSLQVACLSGRWLMLAPGDSSPDASQCRLLVNLLGAAGILLDQAPTFEGFRWPPMDDMPVESPREEACQGLQAFLEGRRRRGWAPERLLVFGRDETLASVLSLEDGHCRLLDLPAWQLPGLDDLTTSAESKRSLWPQLLDWHHAWQNPEEDGDDSPAGT
jgi:hypothetical protein